jgi:uncharacterized protein (TIGR02145 family)
MYKKFLWMVILSGIIVFSCNKDIPRRAVVTTGNFDLAQAMAHGTLVDKGSQGITDHGFCWDTVGDPTLTNQVVRMGSLNVTGEFQVQLTTLKPVTTYHLRAFIQTGGETLFGSAITFTTPDLPVLTTIPVTDITETYAKSGGNITSDNGSPVLARGICWGNDPVPDTTGSHTNDGPGSGTFSSVLSGLTANTQYNVRAYATSIYGTRYADELTFSTGQNATAPFIGTSAVSLITQTSATCGGNVVADGGQPVTLRGVCWSTVPYPTTSGNKTEDGSGTGVFTSSLTGLSPNTTYYVRAYATNEIGTSYGNEISFTTEKAPDLPNVITTAVTNITDTSATSGGMVTADGGSPVTARGVCWNTAPNPTTANAHTTDGSGLGSFTSSITGLSAATKYYVRAYATSTAGTAYGNEISFTAGQSVTTPMVTTNTVSNIAQTTATCGGDVTADGGAPVTVRGVCWSTSANPTTVNSHTTDGSGLGAFTSNLTGLTAKTQYYVRAYATNTAGTSYGNERVFTTLPEVTVPSVTTAPLTNITSNSATSGGTVTADGGAPVTARGICWSASPNPTTANSHTSDGTGTGSFVSQLTGLSSGTQYYVRAYATNSAGTAYGNQQVFSTLTDPVLPTVTTAPVTDITQTTATSGGTVYSDGGAPVTARGVCWSTSPNPTTGDNHTTDGTGTGTFVSYLTNLSPNTTYYVRAYATNSVGTAYGNQEVFTTLQTVTLPTVTTDPATSITQTTATCGGNVTSAGGGTVTARGVCWATTPSPTLSNSYTVNGTGTGTFVSYLTGLTPCTLYYVRAYATNVAGTGYGNELTFTTLCNLPTVTTTDASGITATTATTGGNVTSDGGSPVTARGVCYNTAPNPTLLNSYTTNGTGLGIFTSNLTGLTPSTLYYVRAYATNANGTVYGNEISFPTFPWQCGDTINYSSQIYNTILIGTQCWMKENLNVGTMIPGSQNQTNNSQIEKYCYDNDLSKCNIHGGLYQWDEIMQYTTTPGVQGICKTGWHIPTDSEWLVLDTYLGGSNVSGGKLKETGTLHWAPPNVGATNSSGFTGIPGGSRNQDFIFYNLSFYCYLWSSTQYSTTHAWTPVLGYQLESTNWSYHEKTFGFTVRCLKN